MGTVSKAIGGLLDMTKAARMKRAAKQGALPDDYYHGTAKEGYVESTDIKAFDKDKVGDRWSADDSEFFFTNDTGEASYYANSDADYRNPGAGHGAVYPVRLMPKNPLIVDDAFLAKEGMAPIGKVEDTVGFWDNYQGLIKEWMADGGHDSAILRDITTKTPSGKPREMVAITRPEHIRSATSAAFDPAKRSSANILASGAPVALGGLLAAGGSEDAEAGAIPKALSTALKKAAPDASSFVSENADAINLSKLVVPKDARGSGQGSKFMDELNAYADKSGKPVVLTADGDFGGSKAGQQRFYKRHGFKDNKGKNKDYRFTENMIRNPATAAGTAGAGLLGAGASNKGYAAPLPYEDRINNPQDYPTIDNGNGSLSTHRMAAEVDEDGNWFVFPTIVQMPDGKLKQFEDAREAMAYNKSIGNIKPMANKEEALAYSKGGYKTPAFNNYYNMSAMLGLGDEKPQAPSAQSLFDMHGGRMEEAQAPQHPRLAQAAGLLGEVETPLDPLLGQGFLTEGAAGLLDKLSYGDERKYSDYVKMALDFF